MHRIALALSPMSVVISIPFRTTMNNDPTGGHRLLEINYSIASCAKRSSGQDGKSLA